MKKVAKGVLKAKMLEYLRDVEETGEELVVTSNGKPVVRILPFNERRDVEDLFAEARKKARFHEDPRTPTGDEWSET